MATIQCAGVPMNYGRMAIAVVCAFVAYMALGGAIFAAVPSPKAEFSKYPNVYRSHEGQMSHFPAGMFGIFLSISVMTALYAMSYRLGSGVGAGAIFGVLIGLFYLGSFVLHNYANQNIGLRLTLFSAVAFMVEWTFVGVVLGLVYQPR
jgi:hypothetical protein